MNTLAYSSNDSYKYRLAKTRENVLKGIYKNSEKSFIQPERTKKENMRLRLRFKEAVQEAQDTCKDKGEKSKECHFAWYEVDELEDSMNRYYPDL